MSDKDDETYAQPAEIPVTWREGDNTHLRQVNGMPAGVVLADGKAISTYAEAPYETCGNCKYFELKKGQEAILRERFAERLVREEGWMLRHLGVPVEHLGLCGAGNGETVTTPVSKSCDQFRHAGRRR